MPLVYRFGNFTPSNFTPRPADTIPPGEGLSVNLNMPQQRAQEIDSDDLAVTVLQNTPTEHNPNHHSILPQQGGAQALANWAATRGHFAGNGNNWNNPNIDQYTQDVHDARTQQVN